MDGFVEEKLTRLRDYNMLSIRTKGTMGSLMLELVAHPDFSRAFGHGMNASAEILFLECKSQS